MRNLLWRVAFLPFDIGVTVALTVSDRVVNRFVW